MTERHYRHLGQSIRSDRALARLTPLTTVPPAVDIVIDSSGTPTPVPNSLPWRKVLAPVSWRAGPDGASWLRLRYFDDARWAQFDISPDGSGVWVLSSDAVRWEDLSELLIGPVFSCILMQRAVTCLHAGVVRIAGRTIGLVGAKGAGKSTLTLALIDAGAELISDDVAVLDVLDGRPAVAVGPARLRVESASAAFAGRSFEELAPVWGEYGHGAQKRYVETQRDSLEPLLPLDAVYFLAPRDPAGTPLSINRVSAVTALPALMANRHMVHLSERSGDMRDFGVLARVAAALPISEIHRPDDLSQVENTVAALAAEAGLLSAAR